MSGASTHGSRVRRPDRGRSLVGDARRHLVLVRQLLASRGEITKLSPKQGVVVQGEGNGWSRTVYTVTPGIPGDSGSGFLSDSGQAIGTLSTVAVAPLPASNGVADLRSELDYMRANSGFAGVQLVPGNRPFNGDLVGAILGG